MKTLYAKLHSLTNQELIRLSSELRRSIVPEDALIREVIKDTEVDTNAPILAFIAVGTNLNFVLADRLEKLQLQYDQLRMMIS